jgi:ankyrin repeat protein
MIRIILSAGGLLMLSTKLGAQTETFDKEFERTSQVIVMLAADYAGTPEYGAGIAFGRRGDRVFIATADHILRKGSQEPTHVWVGFRSLPGKRLEATVVKHGLDEGIDAGILAVDGIRALGIDPCMIPFDRLSSLDSLTRGNDASPVGNPNGVAWAMPVTPDKVARVDGADIIFQSTFLSRGHSGGGLLSWSALILGMTIADEPPFGRAIRIDTLLNRAKRWGYPVRMTTPLDKGWTELHVVAADTDTARIREVLSECSSINAKNDHQSTPLHLAAAYSTPAVIGILLKAGADVNSRDADGDPPLEWATEKGRVENARALVRGGAKLGLKNAQGRTSLHVAAREGQFEMVRFLVGAGADVNASDEGKRLPLDLADSVGIMRFLIGAGAKVNGRRLCDRMEYDRTEAVTILLRAVVDINAPTCGGDPPLAFAANAGKLEMVRLLVAAGADINAKGSGNRTALYYAIYHQHGEIEEFLFAHGANARSLENEDREQLLGYAVEDGRVSTVKQLLAAGTDPNKSQTRNSRLLDAAIEQEDTAMVRALVKAGADLTEDWDGILPLRRAMDKRLTAIVEILRAAGAKEE